MGKSSKERVFAALNLEEPDAVPLFDFVYENRSFENILGYRLDAVTPKVLVEGHKALNLDFLCSGPGSPEGWMDKRLPPDIKVDEWGIKWKYTREYIALPWYLEGPIRNPEDIEAYCMPDPHAPGRLKDLESVLKIVGDDLAVAAAFPIGGPFTAASMLMGFAPFLKTVMTKPHLASKLLKAQVDYCIEIGERCVEAGVEIIFLNDDLGDVHGPLLAPKLFRKHVLPHLKTLTETFKKRDVKVLLHCDGNVKPIMGDLVDMGIDGFHPMERKAMMDIREMKTMYGDRLCLIGNVDASILLPLGKPEEIREQVIECMENAAPSGGYIFASDHSIHPGIPGDRAKLLFKTAEKYRRYPIRA